MTFLFDGTDGINGIHRFNLNPPLSGSSNFSNDARNNTLVNVNNPFTFANPFGAINRQTPTSANVLNKDNYQPQVHQWSFDIRSGACTAKGDSPLRRWPSKVSKGRLLAHW